MKKNLALFCITAILSANAALACTTVIISGKYTADGRPILWKNRDTGNPNNKIVYLKDGKLRAIALIDSDDAKSNNIWIGFNNAGFAIMNTEEKLSLWRKNKKLSQAEVDNFYGWVDSYVRKGYSDLFNIRVSEK